MPDQRKARRELVLSMTLAELFLLLMMLVWVASRPGAISLCETELNRCSDERKTLKLRVEALTSQLADREWRLKFWRDRYPGITEPPPGTVPEPTGSGGKDKKPCTSDNVLVQASVINGQTRVQFLSSSMDSIQGLVAAGSPGLLERGTSLASQEDIQRLLAAVEAHSQRNDCRFHYRLDYSTNDDYFVGRTGFEPPFYPGRMRRLK